MEGVCGVCVVGGWFTASPGLSQTDWTLAGWGCTPVVHESNHGTQDKPAINTHTRGGATAMAVVPSARRIPPACKTPNKHPVQHRPLSCVGGPQGKPLRVACGGATLPHWHPTRGSSDQGRTRKGCPSCTGATSRGRGQPPQHQLPLNSSDGQRRSGEAAQLPATVCG